MVALEWGDGAGGDFTTRGIYGHDAEGLFNAVPRCGEHFVGIDFSGDSCQGPRRVPHVRIKDGPPFALYVVRGPIGEE